MVEKDVTTSQESVLGIGFRITSAHGVPVTVCIEDEPPDEDEYETIQLHPDYHPNCWERRERVMRFVTTINPGEVVETAYYLLECKYSYDEPPRPRIVSVETHDVPAVRRGGEPATQITDGNSNIGAEERMGKNQKPKSQNVDRRGKTIELEAPVRDDLVTNSGGREQERHRTDEEKGDHEKLDGEELEEEEIDGEELEEEEIDGEELEEGELPEKTVNEGPSNQDHEIEILSRGEASGRNTAEGTIFDSKFDNDEDGLNDFTELLAESHPISWGEVAATIIDECNHQAIDPHTAATLQEKIFESFVRELGERDDDDEDVVALRSALGNGAPTHLSVRIERVESQLSELAAYTDALREFIDEKGTGRDVLDSLERDLAEVVEELDRVSERTESIGDEGASLRSDLEAVSDELETVETIETRLGTVEERLDERAGELSEVEGRLDSRTDGLESSIDALSEDVEAVDTEIRTFYRVLANTQRQLRALEGSVDKLEGTVEESKEGIDVSIDELETEIKDVRAAIDQLVGHQQQVGQTFQSLASQLASSSE